MKDLYLLRHGIAADSAPGGDAARPLTAEGIAKMELAARGMRKLGITLDLLLTSPLVRARETAAIVGRELGIEPWIADPLAPGCDAGRLSMAIESAPGAKTRIMAVGHEPDLSQLIEALCGARAEMKKGGLARIALLSLEARYGALLWLLPPAVLRAAA
jgi:phosphohistidine phosphatase